MLLEAGADAAFIEAPQSLEELQQIPKLVKGVCFVNILHGGKTPLVGEKQLEEMGYKMLVYPTTILFNYVKHCQDILAVLKNTRNANSVTSSDMVSFQEYAEIVGLSRYNAVERNVAKLVC